jgi:hypothetical protein
MHWLSRLEVSPSLARGSDQAEKQVRERNSADRRDGTGTDADLGRENNECWFTRRKTILTRRTSLLIDPPDGKLPAVTDEAQRRRAAYADYLRAHPADSWEDRRLNERCIMFLQSGPPIIPTNGPWTKPWTAALLIEKSEGVIYEFACHEGNYALPNVLSGARAQERLAGEAAKKRSR